MIREKYGALIFESFLLGSFEDIARNEGGGMRR
jgi:hypothetical protein